jgi:GAF domain-containing protein
VVAVEDLRSELVWDRVAVVVRQLQVRGVLSVPVRLADQPVGTLHVYATQPRAWTPAEAQALAAFAVATAGVALDEAFRQLRARARASSSKLADAAQEVVQEVQRGRAAAKALEDARVQAALERTQDVLAGRDRAADQRHRAANQRDQAADDPE